MERYQNQIASHLSALKINPATTAEMLHPLFVKIWEKEKVPTEWKHGYLVKLPKKRDLGLFNKGHLYPQQGILLHNP